MEYAQPQRQGESERSARQLCRYAADKFKRQDSRVAIAKPTQGAAQAMKISAIAQPVRLSRKLLPAHAPVGIGRGCRAARMGCFREYLERREFVAPGPWLWGHRGQWTAAARRDRGQGARRQRSNEMATCPHAPTLARGSPDPVRPSPAAHLVTRGGPVNSASMTTATSSLTPMVVPGAGIPYAIPNSERFSVPCAENPIRALGSIGWPA